MMDPNPHESQGRCLFRLAPERGFRVLSALRLCLPAPGQRISRANAIKGDGRTGEADDQLENQILNLALRVAIGDQAGPDRIDHDVALESRGAQTLVGGL